MKTKTRVTLALIGSVVLAGCSSSGSTTRTPPASSASGSSSTAVSPSPSSPSPSSTAASGPSSPGSVVPSTFIEVEVVLTRRVPVPSKRAVVYLRGTSAPLQVGTVTGYGPQREPRLLLYVSRDAHVPANVTVRVCADVVALLAPYTPGRDLFENAVIPADRTQTADTDCDHGGGA